MTFITGSHACIGYRFAVIEWAFLVAIGYIFLAYSYLLMDTLSGILLGRRPFYLDLFDHLILSSLFLRNRSFGSRWSWRDHFWPRTRIVGHNCHSLFDLQRRVDGPNHEGSAHSVSNRDHSNEVSHSKLLNFNWPVCIEIGVGRGRGFKSHGQSATTTRYRITI